MRTFLLGMMSWVTIESWRKGSYPESHQPDITKINAKIIIINGYYKMTKVT